MSIRILLTNYLNAVTVASMMIVKDQNKQPECSTALTLDAPFAIPRLHDQSQNVGGGRFFILTCESAASEAQSGCIRWLKGEK